MAIYYIHLKNTEDELDVTYVSELIEKRVEDLEGLDVVCKEMGESHLVVLRVSDTTATFNQIKSFEVSLEGEQYFDGFFKEEEEEKIQHYEAVFMKKYTGGVGGSEAKWSPHIGF